MVNFDNPYFKLEIDEARRIARATRTSLKFPDIATVEQVFVALAAAAKDIPRATYALLLDLREGPLRNDEAFESTVRKHTATTIDGWRKSAVLVRSAVGELQINRQSRESGAHRDVFRDEAEALRFLEA